MTAQLHSKMFKIVVHSPRQSFLDQSSIPISWIVQFLISGPSNFVDRSFQVFSSVQFNSHGPFALIQALLIRVNLDIGGRFRSSLARADYDMLVLRFLTTVWSAFYRTGLATDQSEFRDRLVSVLGCLILSKLNKILQNWEVLIKSSWRVIIGNKYLIINKL